MAINSNLLRRPSDRNLYIAAAVLFPLLVLIGYFKTYYFSAFFSDVRPVANGLVHLHGIVMTVWVVYFSAQIALVRTKNLKLHMSLGMVGIILAALVVIVGLTTAYDSHIVRATAPPGIHPHTFLIVPIADMSLFILFFAGAIYYRKRPAEHKTLMLLTALNFLAAPLGRIQIVPEKYFIFWAFGIPCLVAIACLVWFTIKHRKINKVFALGVFLLVISYPLRIYIGFSESWLKLVGWMTS